MQKPLPTDATTFTAPRFYLTDRQPIRPGVIVLSIAAMVGALYSVSYGVGHARRAHRALDSSDTAQSASSASQATDDEDDPSQIDTVVLGDPADAPVPARRGDHVSPVHPTIVIRLPRYGDQVGLIPDTAAGHLLYRWLAGFNQTSYRGLSDALPSVALTSSTKAQMELRQQTGGFNLISAKEVQPGVLVFRLRDQTPSAVESLGTLQVRPNSSPATIESFSLRALTGTQPPARR